MAIKDNLIVGIDIGSSKVAICAANYNDDKIQIVGLSAIPHTGMKHGIISNPEESVSTISEALEEVERSAGANITHAFVTINGRHIETTAAKGVIAITKPNQVIDQNDIERAKESARAVAIPQNRELIYALPHSYTVDSQEDLRDPIGMTGIRLESNMLIVSASSIAVRNLHRTIEQAGVAIDDIVFSPLALSSLITNKKQREAGAVVIDIGFGSTSIAVYEEGDLRYCSCIPVGSNSITNDLAIGLKINLDAAEKIKLKFGTTNNSKIRENEVINLSQFDPEENEKISKKQVGDIIEARVHEIFNLVKADLKKIDKDEILPAGAILSGGGSLIDGITQTAKNTLRIPASLGYPEIPLSGLIDKLDNPIYYASVGLVVWGLENTHIDTSWKPGFDGLGGLINRLRGVFKNFTK